MVVASTSIIVRPTTPGASPKSTLTPLALETDRLRAQDPAAPYHRLIAALAPALALRPLIPSIHRWKMFVSGRTAPAVGEDLWCLRLHLKGRPSTLMVGRTCLSLFLLYPLSQLCPLCLLFLRCLSCRNTSWICRCCLPTLHSCCNNSVTDLVRGTLHPVGGVVRRSMEMVTRNGHGNPRRARMDRRDSLVAETNGIIGQGHPLAAPRLGWMVMSGRGRGTVRVDLRVGCSSRIRGLRRRRLYLCRSHLRRKIFDLMLVVG